MTCSCGPGMLLLLMALPEVVADDNLAARHVLRVARGPEETSLNQKNKCVSFSSSLKPAAAEQCPIEQAQLQPSHDSPQVALAAVCRADVVPKIWHFSVVMENVHQLCCHGGGRAPARRLAAAFPTPGAILAEPAQDSWLGWGEARSRCRREAPKGREGVAVMGQDMLCRPPPPFWLEHAALTTPLGPGGADTAVNCGRRQPGQLRHAAKPASEECSATTCHRAPHQEEPWQSELLLTAHVSWRDGAEPAAWSILLAPWPQRLRAALYPPGLHQARHGTALLGTCEVCSRAECGATDTGVAQRMLQLRCHAAPFAKVPILQKTERVVRP